MTLREMQANGVVPDDRTYATLLAGLCRERRIEALEIVEEAFGLGRGVAHHPGATIIRASHGGPAPGVEGQQLARFLELIPLQDAAKLLERIQQTEVGATIAPRLMPRFAHADVCRMPRPFNRWRDGGREKVPWSGAEFRTKARPERPGFNGQKRPGLDAFDPTTNLGNGSPTTPRNSMLTIQLAETPPRLTRQSTDSI